MEIIFHWSLSCGFVIFYAICSVIWCNKLLTAIALSMTESKYIAMSSAMREMILFLNLMQENAFSFGLLTHKPIFNCTVIDESYIMWQ